LDKFIKIPENENWRKNDSEVELKWINLQIK
jgi:hypothetical protein